MKEALHANDFEFTKRPPQILRMTTSYVLNNYALLQWPAPPHSPLASYLLGVHSISDFFPPVKQQRKRTYNEQFHKHAAEHENHEEL